MSRFLCMGASMSPVTSRPEFSLQSGVAPNPGLVRDDEFQWNLSEGPSSTLVYFLIL